MAQQNQDTPTFTTLLSDPHFNLSAHTFAMHTLPFHHISFVLDLLTNDDAATQNLLTLDRINQTIVSLERLRRRQPTPFSSPAPSSSSSARSPPSSSTRSRRQRTSPYSRPLPSIPPPFPPLTTRSGRVYPRNYFEANAADCLRHLQTVLEERRWGTAPFPIVVEAPEAEDNIFQRYYRWFINEGRD